ncbi:MAG: hypothetical protein ACLR3R_18570 [Clostridium paraputrificum]
MRRRILKLISIAYWGKFFLYQINLTNYEDKRMFYVIGGVAALALGGLLGGIIDKMLPKKSKPNITINKPSEELNKLYELMEHGAISNREYKKMKRKIINM